MARFLVRKKEELYKEKSYKKKFYYMRHSQKNGYDHVYNPSTDRLSERAISDFIINAYLNNHQIKYAPSARDLIPQIKQRLQKSIGKNKSKNPQKAEKLEAILKFRL